jgi:hypothetical protein
MKPALKLLLACAPMVFIAACGGGDDLEDRLDLADPVVRFVHASPLAPDVTLYRANVAHKDANGPYLTASNYEYTSTAAADWVIKTTSGNVQVGDTINVDPQRGNKYTFVALPTTASENNLYVIRDPYNKPLTSESTKLRVMNASFNSGTVDLYMTTGTDADISPSSVSPLIPAVAYKTAGPASGSDSIDIPGNNATTNPSYQVRVYATGTKVNPLFSGRVTFGNNQDVLLVTVPDFANGGIKLLKKVEGTLAATEVAPG